MQLHSLTLVGALLLAGFAHQAVAAPEDSSSSNPTGKTCRCLPTQPCWPDKASWDAFGQTVGGLITTTPPAYECHDPHYNEAKCQEIQKGYFFDHWRQHQPGAMQQVNWEMAGDRGCLGFNKTSQCYQGAVPLYTVKALTFEHVQNTVRFAAKNNIRLAIKNTGHDYLGRSTAASSINLWVYYMKDMTFSDNFVPEGAPAGSSGSGAVVLGSGVLWKDVYRAAEDHKVVVVGGAEATVGTSGGYCQAGGHSPLSPRLGLCVDNVLQYKVVTADGELKVANSHQNTDLFWALRGGGGGTFGVVVEAVYKTHPAFDNINFAGYRLFFRNDTETIPKILNAFLSRQVEWSDAGWSGYAYVMENFMAILYYLPNADRATAQASFDPFLGVLANLGTVKVEGNITNFPSFWKVFDSAPPSTEGNAGHNALLGSRLIPRRNFESTKGVEDLTTALVNIQKDLKEYGNPVGTFITHLVAGGAVRNGTNAETSVLPAWRKALMHIVDMTAWNDDTPLALQKLFARKLTAANQRLRDLTPGSGAYFNEADPNEPNWQTNFFGSNYKRLKAIKDKVDPQGVFACSKCVGSEDWNSDLTCRRR
ncbi:hypothetical protein BGZ75_001399 [Mortierella antarctica]|nr:hypothetical protein BGZ75_001399 [Mortierella antarctica]